MKIVICNEITYPMCEALLPLFYKLSEVDMILVSEGGSLTAALAMYDGLRRVEKTTIVASGMCGSSANIILQAAKVRRATPTTHFFMHKVDVTNDEGEDWLGSRLDDTVRRIIANRTGQENYQKAMSDRIFNAQRALELGFIDEIVIEAMDLSKREENCPLCGTETKESETKEVEGDQ